MKRFDITDESGLRIARDYLAGRGEYSGIASVVEEKMEAARAIVEAVRTRGDNALAEFSSRFDQADLTPAQFEVSPEEIDAATAELDTELLGILKRAHSNIERFHTRNLRQSWEETLPDGTVLGQRITPIARAGVYVPGGKAFYPSSVLMNIVPARVAGVPEIIMVSPPSYGGSIHPMVLAAARIAGATRVFRIGGAQSIAALAYGTETIPAVDKITGPGNAFVTAAKALVRSTVAIDSEAGPSEVLVLADAKASPAYVAAEMFAQAEHDEDAMAILVTDSADLANAVAEYIEVILPTHPRKAIIEQSFARHGALIVTPNLDEAISLTNLMAPEHLSIQTAAPRAVSEKIQHAGAMMLGEWTPVAVGDYYAGPNHILPTCRQARFSSPLSAEDFRKVSSILHYTREKLAVDAQDIITFARMEELEAHARSIEVRLES